MQPSLCGLGSSLSKKKRFDPTRLRAWLVSLPSVFRLSMLRALSKRNALSLSLRRDTNVECLGALSLWLLPRVRRELLHTLLFAVPAL